jgi:xanthine dehydrogenase accessory factor
MVEKRIWEFIAGELGKDKPVCLITMVDAKGHGPNRAGSKLVVTADDQRMGTVGGGKAEFYLVEKAKKILAPKKREKSPKVVYMDHRKVDHDAASGLICGGSQTFVLMRLTSDDLETVLSIIETYNKNEPVTFQLHPSTGLTRNSGLGWKKFFWFRTGSLWFYEEMRGVSDIVTLIGGGHVSLALSQVLSTLDMKIVVLDNRSDLDTMAENTWADECRVVDYKAINDEVAEGPQSYVCIMTFGHQHDEQVLEALIDKHVQYLGMMGSPPKIESIYNNLRSRGVTEEQLAKVHAPIGVPIGSNTPAEIAVSIAAEIIREKNCF